MFAENLFPPIPSEVIMPLAGFTAAGGDLHIVIVVLAGSVGSLLGAVFRYHVGLRVGSDRLKSWAGRHGRVLNVTPAHRDAALAAFGRPRGQEVIPGTRVSRRP